MLRTAQPGRGARNGDGTTSRLNAHCGVPITVPWVTTSDLVAVGSGPAGQKAAIQAAKLSRRAAVVDRGHMMGGVCINTGTIPSKTLREAVLYLTGMNQRGSTARATGSRRPSPRTTCGGG
jgi:hypothetical protein